MYLASILVIALSWPSRCAGAWRSRYAWALLGLLGVQILVGALNVWLDEYELLILLHLALGTLLWATSLGMTLQLSPARERAPRRAEALTA